MNQLNDQQHMKRLASRLAIRDTDSKWMVKWKLDFIFERSGKNLNIFRDDATLYQQMKSQYKLEQYKIALYSIALSASIIGFINRKKIRTQTFTKLRTAKYLFGFTLLSILNASILHPALMEPSILQTYKKIALQNKQVFYNSEKIHQLIKPMNKF